MRPAKKQTLLPRSAEIPDVRSITFGGHEVIVPATIVTYQQKQLTMIRPWLSIVVWVMSYIIWFAALAVIRKPFEGFLSGGDWPFALLIVVVLLAFVVNLLPPALAAHLICEWLLRKFIIPKIAPAGRCNRCGYAPDTLPLTGDEIICPECGTACMLLKRPVATPSTDGHQEPG